MRYLLFLLFLPLLFLTCSQNSIKKNQKKSQDLKKIQQLLENLQKEEGFVNGHIAFSLFDLKNKKSLIEINADKSLIVASCLKVVTTAASYEVLGKDFRFKTQLEHSGDIKNNVLVGNLYIKGGGDPTLCSNLLNAPKIEETFKQWKNKMVGFGIKSIQGKIIFDDSEYPTDIMPAEWIWGDMGNYFGSPACAFNIFDNTYQIYLKPANRLNEKPNIIKTDPDVNDQIKFVNELITAEAGTGDLSTINGHIYDKYRYLNGSIPLGNTFIIKGAMPDPAFFLAKMFYKYLDTNKISVTEKFTTARLLNTQKKESRKILSTFDSFYTLKQIIRPTNIYSSNLFAEAILKRIGANIMRKPSTNAGTKSLTDFWASQNINTKGMILKDGSGLARSNLITANQLTQILSKTFTKSYFSDFYQSLPLAGKEGTMVNVGKNLNKIYELRAKTGGMSRVFAMTGYFKNSDRQIHAFTLIFNNYTCSYTDLKNKFEEFIKVMAENT